MRQGHGGQRHGKDIRDRGDRRTDATTAGRGATAGRRAIAATRTPASAGSGAAAGSPAHGAASRDAAATGTRTPAGPDATGPEASRGPGSVRARAGHGGPARPDLPGTGHRHGVAVRVRGPRRRGEPRRSATGLLDAGPAVSAGSPAGSRSRAAAGDPREQDRERRCDEEARARERGHEEQTWVRVPQEDGPDATRGSARTGLRRLGSTVARCGGQGRLLRGPRGQRLNVSGSALCGTRK
ncbi:MAG: hypothetical protein JWO98_2975 [Frankiales bacterium]|nr:hypothetical protein [Frankiales bacterium]